MARKGWVARCNGRQRLVYLPKGFEKLLKIIKEDASKG
jgi:hypothetical protein